MRLTHLKLAGFKSFVEPTTIHLHGQRVGVVGPNGCGKSNVMESVRWVLGESSAKEMRADAMDAVIFNGSGNRKAISRASVELVFDNSMGGASGEWNQYAEISVKRVIEREKGSTYFINNTAVRRRDVADLFLGTGLGGRAYAIIGQNTISRIVEARPEELRVFLEEAAGISKYKERRRETELRLRDTRENLTRVEDVCRELGKQIGRLETQAMVTQRYHQLQAAFKFAEAQLWWLKKRDASLAWEKARQHVEQSVNRLESQMATLRATETALETLRQSHYVASDQINQAQARYYECNANVSNLELQVKQSEEAKERLRTQLLQIESGLERHQSQLIQLNTQLDSQQTQLQTVDLEVNEGTTLLKAMQAGLPEKSSSLQAVNQEAQQTQQRVQESRQKLQLEQNNVQFMNRNLQELEQRMLTLNKELANWALPNLSEQQALAQQLQNKQGDVLLFEQTLSDARQQETQALEQLQQLRQALQQAQRAQSQVEAEVSSLEKLQQALKQEGHLGQWMQQHGLNALPRLWQQIHISTQWQTALEAVLGARLNAIIQQEQKNFARPPASMALGLSSQVVSESSSWQGLPSILSELELKKPELAGLLSDWLYGVYLVSSPEQVEQYRTKLSAGLWLLTPAGDLYSRYSVIYHGQQSGMHGVLERQQHLETLQQTLPDLKVQVQQAQARIQASELQLQHSRTAQQNAHQQIKQVTSEMHQLQMQVSRLKQVHENALRRQTELQQDMTQTQSKTEKMRLDLTAIQTLIAEIQSNFAGLEQAAREAASRKQQTEQAYFALRDDLQQAEKQQQAREFNFTLLKNAVNDFNQKIAQNQEQIQLLTIRQKETHEALAISNMEALKGQLSEAVNRQHEAEQVLSSARQYLSEQEAALQVQERERLTQEHALHPLRDAVEQGRLKEQEIRITVDQCQQTLSETGLNSQTLADSLSVDAQAKDFVSSTQKLQQEIQALGAVNMAAIEELATEKERKQYLDSQMQDLLTASTTLEDAILKIDRETRGKLKATFDEVNRNFGELFNTLFSGGQAKLELLGEEILDTGIQVFAQPPGKKNTTIQLLSGGEKALTAIALVFALFKLNPAPFCLMDEVDAPLDDSNTERFCKMVRTMSDRTQFLFVSHNKITMEMAQQMIGVTMQESGVSRVVDVDIEEAIRMHAA